MMIRYFILLLLVVAWESLASTSVGYSTQYPLNSACAGTPSQVTVLFGRSGACFPTYPSTLYGTSPTITFLGMLNNCSSSGLFNYYNDSTCQFLVYQSNSVCVGGQSDDYLTVCGPSTTPTPTTSPTASPIRPK